MTAQIDEKEIAVLEKEIMPVIKSAMKIEIKSQKDMEKATLSLSQLNTYADSIKKRKEEITKPINAGLKAIREMFKPLETQLDEAIESRRNAMSEYQTEQVRIANEEAEKIANRVGEGKGKFSKDTASRKIGKIEKPEEKVSTVAGSVSFRPEKKFEVMDIIKIAALSDDARKYLLPNEIAIREAMKAGIEIPGVRYYEIQVPVNNRK